jgi:hypothetical protein
VQHAPDLLHHRRRICLLDLSPTFEPEHRRRFDEGDADDGARAIEHGVDRRLERAPWVGLRVSAVPAALRVPELDARNERA